MTHFQIPEGRTFHSSVSGLKPWPHLADGYRLFISGSGPQEGIGIQVGQTIKLQLTGGKDCRIETERSFGVRVRPAYPPIDPALERTPPSPVTVSTAFATSERQEFSVTATGAGGTTLLASDAANNVKARLSVLAGDFVKDTAMATDLIAEVCRGPDSLKIHALQRMLNNRHVSGDVFTNGDNIFEQKAPSNHHPEHGQLTCGLVSRWRGEEIFKTPAVADDWYLRPIHEPVRTIKTRNDVKYKPDKIQKLRAHIVAALKDKKAVPVGVFDRRPEGYTGGITTEGGKIVAYRWYGHSALIVGCNSAETDFLYIDPWGGGSMREYKGGISSVRGPSGKCPHLGVFTLTEEPARRVTASDRGPNLLRQSSHTEGSFGAAGGNFLEVVSARVPAS